MEIDFEIFIDASYFDLWAVRPKGEKRFGKALHFGTEEEANHAKDLINEWITEQAAAILI